jgi:hypothetical protein
MMQIVQEYSEASSSSLTAYLHFLRDVEPIVACCLEIRYLIAQQGLLRLFFILMRCCNRSGPSAVLLSKVLSILQLFTVKRALIIPLIDKQEQIKDFIMLLLKYYQKNRSELFEQICSLFESIVNDEYARKVNILLFIKILFNGIFFLNRCYDRINYLRMQLNMFINVYLIKHQLKMKNIDNKYDQHLNNRLDHKNVEQRY